MTMYEYFIMLPRKQFGNIIADLVYGMTGVDIEDRLSKVLDEPCSTYYGPGGPPMFAEEIMGRSFSTLPDDEKERLCNAVKGYSEVGVLINEQNQSNIP